MALMGNQGEKVGASSKGVSAVVGHSFAGQVFPFDRLMRRDASYEAGT